MPIFGQVWLWSSLAFLLGALLCWGLVALPARRRVGELEAELAAGTARPASPARSASFRDSEPDRRPGPPRDLSPAEIENESLTRAYALSGVRGESGREGVTAPPETGGTAGSGTATQYLTSGSPALQAPPEVPPQDPDRGWFDSDRERGGPGGEESPAATTVLPAVRADEPPSDGRLVDDEDDDLSRDYRDDRAADDRSDDRSEDRDDDDGGTVFTQRTHPIPGELIRRLDDSAVDEPADSPDRGDADRPVPERADEPVDALVDDLADEPESPEPPESPAERTILTEAIDSGESKHQLQDDPAVTSTLTPVVADEPRPEPQHETRAESQPESRRETRRASRAESKSKVKPEPRESATANGGRDRSVVEPAHDAGQQSTGSSASRGQGVAGDQRTAGTEEPKNMPGVTVQAEPTKSKLPKRVPSKPPSRTPFGVQTTSPVTPPPSAEPAPAGNHDAPRSLFEPIIPAGAGPTVPPPPHRLRGEGNGKGPFGPGSAMPLAGGASPGPEFTIKASVSALRYCTPDSEKFDRTVAEVWFRSAADAERVGFRPVG